MIIVNESSANVSFDGVSYPKSFYAQPSHNKNIQIKSKYTEKLFQKEDFDKINIDGAYYTDIITTVNELNKILSV